MKGDYYLSVSNCLAISSLVVVSCRTWLLQYSLSCIQYVYTSPSSGGQTVTYHLSSSGQLSYHTHACTYTRHTHARTYTRHTHKHTHLTSLLVAKLSHTRTYIHTSHTHTSPLFWWPSSLTHARTYTRHKHTHLTSLLVAKLSFKDWIWS